MSKVRNNKLALKLAADRRYKIQRNGVIKKLGSDGKFREVGTERHGYRVVTYNGTKLVIARVMAAKGLTNSNVDTKQAIKALNTKLITRKNAITTDDRAVNLGVALPGRVKREVTKRLSQKQIARMLELFFDGFSVAKIARRFHRRISRSHVSKLIKRELNLDTLVI